MSTSKSTPIEEYFPSYYDQWLAELEELRSQMLKAKRDNSNESVHLDMAVKLQFHFLDFLDKKSDAAEIDVFAFYYPTWLTPLENEFTWITGWKPFLPFTLLKQLRSRPKAYPCFHILEDEQIKKIQKLKSKVAIDVAQLDSDLKGIKGITTKEIVELARLICQAKDTTTDMVGVSTIKKAKARYILAEYERILRLADNVRLSTLEILMEVLTPTQCLTFLLAKSASHVLLRQKGKRGETLSA